MRLNRQSVQKTLKSVKHNISSFLKKSIRFGKKTTQKVRNITRRITFRKH